MFSGVRLVSATCAAHTSHKTKRAVIQINITNIFDVEYLFNLFQINHRLNASKLFLTFETSAVNSGVSLMSIVLGLGKSISITADNLPG